MSLEHFSEINMRLDFEGNAFVAKRLNLYCAFLYNVYSNHKKSPINSHLLGLPIYVKLNIKSYFSLRTISTISTFWKPRGSLLPRRPRSPK